MLKTPVIGPIIRKVVVARFSRTMGTLLSSGVPIPDAMDIVAKTAGNVIVKEGILFTKARISEGQDMATPLMETGLMPPMVVQMIGVGEQTGALDGMLSKIADFYEEEVDVAVAGMTSLIEPIMMVFLGGVIGGLVVAMYLPIAGRWPATIRQPTMGGRRTFRGNYGPATGKDIELGLPQTARHCRG